MVGEILFARWLAGTVRTEGAVIEIGDAPSMNPFATPWSIAALTAEIKIPVPISV